MPGVNDRIVIVFPSDWSAVEVIKIVYDFENIIRKERTVFKDLGDRLRFTLFLNRPDIADFRGSTA